MRTRLYQVVLVLWLLSLAALATGCSVADGAGSPEEGDPAVAEEGSAGGENGSADDPAPGEQGEDDEEGEEEEQAVPVEVVELGLGAIESVLKYSSTLEAESEVQVFSEASRTVRELLVEEGDQVRRGQVLLRLQDEEQRNNLAKVSNELAKAEREYKRQQRLYNEKLISEEEFSDATFDLEQLRIALADVERELGYTEVKAPISGTITQRMINLGAHVSVNQHLFDIIDFDSLVARIYVPEKHLGELRPGLIARISTLSTREIGGRDYSGNVERIAPVVDPRSGTVKVTVDVGGQPGLRPGMYVDVDLVTATRENAVLLPKRALIYDNDQMFVFRLGEERRVERIFIQPRLADKHNVEPLDGLVAGDQIVVAGQAGLKDGALVSLPGDEEQVADKDAEPADAQQAT